MTPDELQSQREKLTQNLNLAMAQTLKAIEVQMQFGALVNVIAYEQERRKNSIQIAGSLPNGRLITQ